jgi:hypothetical protein
MHPNSDRQPIAFTAHERMRANLRALSHAALNAAAADQRGDIFDTAQGRALANAIYDVTRLDAVYDCRRSRERADEAPPTVPGDAPRHRSRGAGSPDRRQSPELARKIEAI